MNQNWMRKIGEALTLGLTFVAVAGLIATVGCARAKKTNFEDKTTIEEPTDPRETLSAKDSGGGNTLSVPPSDLADSPRPGAVVPFPELKVIYFDFDRSRLRADQLDRVEANLKYLLAHPEINVQIEGHCDEQGTLEYNFALGHRRARALRAYFLRFGVAAERIAILSKGEEEPAALGHDEAAWNQNRRVEFKRYY